MATVYHGQALGKALEAEGLLPPHARLIELVVPADGAVVLRFEVFVARDDLMKIARALQTLATKDA